VDDKRGEKRYKSVCACCVSELTPGETVIASTSLVLAESGRSASRGIDEDSRGTGPFRKGKNAMIGFGFDMLTGQGISQVQQADHAGAASREDRQDCVLGNRPRYDSPKGRAARAHCFRRTNVHITVSRRPVSAVFCSTPIFMLASPGRTLPIMWSSSSSLSVAKLDCIIARTDC